MSRHMVYSICQENNQWPCLTGQAKGIAYASLENGGERYGKYSLPTGWNSTTSLSGCLSVF